MKKQLLFLTILFALTFPEVKATIRTVSNNTGSPGQYTNLQTAINIAAIGDTILVAGSTTSYGSITFGKPLVLIGAGYNNPYGSNTTIDQMILTRQSYYISASGSKIMGFIFTATVGFKGVFSGGTTSSQTIDNVVIERSMFSSSSSFSFGYSGSISQTFNNDTIRNCLINSNLTYYPYYSDGSQNLTHTFNNICIHNNIFNGSYISMGINSTYFNDCSRFYLRNNIFINRTSNCFSYVYNMIVENNIFYGAEPQGGTGCVFSKNLTYMCVNNTIPGTGNLGSGNKVNQNPQFVNYPVAGGAFSFSYNFQLQPTSPGKNAGTDGTDIGIYGGMMPYLVGANPYVPQMMETTLPSGSSVPSGGTLNVHFKAGKQN